MVIVEWGLKGADMQSRLRGAVARTLGAASAILVLAFVVSAGTKWM
jgi:hypothetical protein